MGNSTSIFSMSDPSLKYLAMIWGNVLFPGGAVQSGVMNAVTSAITTVVLSVAAGFFTWQLIAGTAQSAHHGEVLGKNWSSLWVPVRFVVAGAMMIPVGSDGSIGLQMLIASIVKLALGAGDYVAAMALSALMAGSPISVPPSQPVDNMAKEAWDLVVCMESWNTYGLTGVQAQSSSQATAGQLSLTLPSGMLAEFGMMPQSNLGSVQTSDCPVISVPNAQNYQAFAQAKQAAISRLISGFEPIAQSLAAAARPNLGGADLSPPSASAITAVVTSVQAKYNTAIQSAVQSAAQQIQTQLQTQASGAGAPGGANSSQAPSGMNFSSLTSCGFVCLGSYYNQMARMNSDAVTDMTIAPTETVAAIGADMSGEQSSNFDDQKAFFSAAKDLWAASNDPARQGWTPSTPVYGVYTSGSSSNTSGGSGKDASKKSDNDSAWGSITKGISGAFAGILNFFSGASVTSWFQADSTNPLGSLASLGAWMTNLGLSAEEALSIMASKEDASRILNTGAGALLQDGTHAIVLGGLLLSEVMPMMPYLLWILSFVAYLTLVTEALVAAPLWGFAHLKTGGEGIHGEATSGYMIVFNIMFRPSLMVAGFIAGMAIFSAATEVVNNTFSAAVLAAYAGTSTVSTGASVAAGLASGAIAGAAGGLLSGSFSAAKNAVMGFTIAVIVKLVVTIAVKFFIMIGLLFVIAERSFALIHSLPDAVARWIGGSGERLSEGEGGEKVRGLVLSNKRQVSGATGSMTKRRLGNRAEADRDAARIAATKAAEEE